MGIKRAVQSYITTFLICLMVVSFTSLQVHATESTASTVPGNSDTNLGGEGDGANNVWEYEELGFDDIDGGYRIYLEDKHGAVVQKVVDLWFNELDGETNTLPTGNVADEGRTSIGNEKRQAQIPYSKVKDYLPELKPPIYDHKPFGEQLNQWFETNNTKYPELTNAEAFIVQVFSAAEESKDTIKNLIDNYQHDNYRIVVEAVYWFGYLWPEVYVPYDNGNGPLYFYGTIKELAAFESGNPTLQKAVGVNQTYLDGSWHFARYTNDACATALILLEDDKFSGMKVISETTNSRSRYQYSQILKSDQSFGIHVILREQVSEKWATYDATKYGGTVGTSPGKTPKMSEIAGFGEDTWREVTVIKYYEEAVKQPNGKITYQKVSGPHKQTKICMTIEVQNEPGWVLKEFTQTQEDDGWALYGNINNREKNHTGFSPATVDVDIDRNN